MSNHERIYEGILNWPLSGGPQGATVCGAPPGKSLPPWGLGPDDDLPAHPCGVLLALPGALKTPHGLLDAVQEHMRESHGEQV